MRQWLVALFDWQLWESHYIPLAHCGWTLNHGPLMSISTKCTIWMIEPPTMFQICLWEQKHSCSSSCSCLLRSQYCLPVPIAQNSMTEGPMKPSGYFVSLSLITCQWCPLFLGLLTHLSQVLFVFQPTTVATLKMLLNDELFTWEFWTDCPVNWFCCCCMGVWTLIPSTGIDCSCWVC
jgi:hypothetical protein